MNPVSRWLLLLPFLAAGLSACGTPPESAAPRIELRATFDDGQPIAGVSVVLNGQEAGQTDSAGQLALDVAAGQHMLRLHLDAGEGRVSKAEQSVEVGTQAQAVTVKLPRPVRMLEPLEVTTSMVHLTWERSEEKSFREYKVYAHSYSSAFDETTGQLVYVGTEASQTDFQLTGLYSGGSPFVSADKDLYFRVFVLKEDGSLAGSNVLHVKTPRWANEPHFTRFYQTSVERQFAGAWPIHGVAYDGTALWLLYRQEVGGYYEKDMLTLVRLDPTTRTVLEEFSFQDHLIPRRPHLGRLLALGEFRFQAREVQCVHRRVRTGFHGRRPGGLPDLDGQSPLDEQRGPECEDRAGGPRDGGLPRPASPIPSPNMAGIAPLASPTVPAKSGWPICGNPASSSSMTPERTSGS